MHHKLQKKRNKEGKSNIRSSILGHIPRITPVISAIFWGIINCKKKIAWNGIMINLRMRKKDVSVCFRGLSLAVTEGNNRLHPQNQDSKPLELYSKPGLLHRKQAS
jgi:hypothetical protein